MAVSGGERLSRSKSGREAAAAPKGKPAKEKASKERPPKEKAPKAGMKEKFRNSVKMIMSKKKSGKENGHDADGAADVPSGGKAQDKAKEKDAANFAPPTSPARKRPRLSLNKAARASQKLAPMFEKETVGPKEAAPAPGFAEIAGESKTGSDSPKPAEKTELKHCIASLHNLGNTCFLNSVLQVLRHTPRFTTNLRQLAQDVKITDKERQNLSDEIDDCGEDTCEIMTWTLVKNLNTMYERMERAERNVASGNANYLAIRPYDVLTSIEQLNPMFEGNLQHDAHELLFCLLAYIQDAGKELNKFRTKYRKVAIEKPAVPIISTLNDDDVKMEIKTEDVKQEVEPILSRLTSETFANCNGLLDGDDQASRSSGHSAPAGVLLNGDLQVGDSVSPRRSPRRAAAMNSPASCMDVVHHADSPPRCRRDLTDCLSRTPEKNAFAVCPNKQVITKTPEKSVNGDIYPMRERTMKTVSPHTKRSLEASKQALLGGVTHNATHLNGVKCEESKSDDASAGSLPSELCKDGDGTNDSKSGRVRSNSLTETDTQPPVRTNKRKRRSLDLLGDGPLVSNNSDAKSKSTDKKQLDIMSMFSRKLGGIKRYGITGKVIRTNEPTVTESYKLTSTTCVPGAINGHAENGNAMDTDSEVSFKTHPAARGSDSDCTIDVTLNTKVPAPPPSLKAKQTARKSLGLHRSNMSVQHNQRVPGLHQVVPPPTSASCSENGDSELKQTAMERGSKAVVKIFPLDVTKYIIPKKARSAEDIVANTLSVEDFIKQTFEGQLAVRTKCSECEQSTERREDYQGVSVAVRKDKSSEEDTSDDEEDVKDDADCNWKWMMPAFEEVERLQEDNKYFCDNCRCKVEADRSSHYLTMSNILTIHLKRFAAMSGIFGGVSKINDHVPTPIILPCLKDGCRTRCSIPNHRYELYAVVTHTGISISSGHYVAYVKMAAKDETIKLEPKTEPVKQEPIEETMMETESTAEMADPNNNADTNNNLGASDLESPAPPASAMTLPSGGAKTRSSTSLQGDPQALWMECDDENIRVLSQREFEQTLSPSGAGTPYMLFYKSMQFIGEVPHLPMAVY